MTVGEAFCLPWDGEPVPYGMNRGMKKSPEPCWLQGRIDDPRYHPVYLPGEIPSGSSKPYPGNGGTRVPLLKRCRSQDRLRNQTSGPAAPARTIRRLSGALEREDFSINVFQMYTVDIKTQTRGFVNLFGAKMYTYIQGEITCRFVKQAALTFCVYHAKVCSSMQYHRTAETKTVRQSELPESQRTV